jgi:hypothetical protein
MAARSVSFGTRDSCCDPLAHDIIQILHWLLFVDWYSQLCTEENRRPRERWSIEPQDTDISIQDTLLPMVSVSHSRVSYFSPEKLQQAFLILDVDF